uniref:Uncharacterized protein n=1 Tax=Gossypium raimondii TaxID=29730 RepID=A0A0D2TXH2_GOSRA|nr:hypothetical protein B456_013G081800 [Gossypium raimondii]
MIQSSVVISLAISHLYIWHFHSIYLKSFESLLTDIMNQISSFWGGRIRFQKSKTLRETVKRRNILWFYISYLNTFKQPWKTNSNN